MATYTKEYLQEVLKNNVATVTFTKVNGDTRVMQCTLIPEKINATVYPTDEQKNTFDNINAVVVWDLEKNGWRAFRVDFVTDVKL